MWATALNEFDTSGLYDYRYKLLAGFAGVARQGPHQ